MIAGAASGAGVADGVRGAAPTARRQPRAPPHGRAGRIADGGGARRPADRAGCPTRAWRPAPAACDRRRAVDAADEEVQDRADQVDEDDDHRPQALVVAADGAVVAQQVGDRERSAARAAAARAARRGAGCSGRADRGRWSRRVPFVAHGWSTLGAARASRRASNVRCRAAASRARRTPLLDSVVPGSAPPPGSRDVPGGVP